MATRKMAVVCFLLCLLTPAVGTVLIDPNGAGGFENGTTFSSNGWVLANGEQASTWYLGTAPGNYSGDRCAYISRDGGANWNYSGTVSTVHIYRDVTFPVGETDIRLNFDFNGIGMSSGAAMKVFLLPYLTEVTAGVPFTDTPLGNVVYNETGAWTRTGINIPAYLAGATQRLVFSWRNVGVEYTPGIPPIAIDNISLTSGVPTPLAGNYSIDNTQPTSSVNFNSFLEAVMALNGCGISAPVTFNLSAGQVFSGLNPVLQATGTEANPITFQKSGSGANPLLLSYGSGSMSDAVVSIKGGDYITFEGIDVSGQVIPLTGDSYMTSCEEGFTFWADPGNQNAVKFTMIKYCGIGATPGLENKITLMTGINVKGLSSPVSPNAANTNNTFSHLQISNCGDGVVIQGASSVYPDTGTIIEDCVIGSEEPLNMLGRANYLSAGIKAYFQSGMVLSHNVIRNVSNPGNKAYGLYLENCLSETTVEGNYIHDISTTWSSSVKTATGMHLALNSQGTNQVWVYNNMISGLSCGYTGPGSNLYGTCGIYMLGNYGSYYLDFNSLRVDGADNAYSAAIYVANNTGINRITNNIITNYTVPQTSRGHYGILFEDHETIIGAPGSLSDNNLIYLDNYSNGYPVRGATQSYLNLLVWGDASGMDTNSIVCAPAFLSGKDLHLTTDSPGIDDADDSLSYAAILVDIDDEFRSQALNPYDIGCDETNGPLAMPGPEVRIERIGGVYANLSWDPVPNAVAYRIDCAPTPLGPFTPLTVLGGTQYIANLTENSQFFQVTAVLN